MDALPSPCNHGDSPPRVPVRTCLRGETERSCSLTSLSAWWCAWHVTRMNELSLCLRQWAPRAPSRLTCRFPISARCWIQFFGPIKCSAVIGSDNKSILGRETGALQVWLGDKQMSEYTWHAWLEPADKFNLVADPMTAQRSAVCLHLVANSIYCTSVLPTGPAQASDCSKFTISQFSSTHGSVWRHREGISLVWLGQAQEPHPLAVQTFCLRGAANQS